MFLKEVQTHLHKVYNKAITVSFTPMLYNKNSGTFCKRSGAATKGFEPCEFWFQMGSFNLNTVLYVLEKINEMTAAS